MRRLAAAARRWRSPAPARRAARSASFAVAPTSPRRPAERRGPEQPGRRSRSPLTLTQRRPLVEQPPLRPAAGALAAAPARLRHPLAGARGDQQGRVELRPQHGPELGRRDRLDAVHARRPGCAGASTATATASPTRGAPRTRSPPRRATSPPPAARPTSRAPSSPTTTRSGTSTRCCSWRSSSPAAGSTRRSTSTGCRRRSSRRRQAVVHANAELLRRERDAAGARRRAARSTARGVDATALRPARAPAARRARPASAQRAPGDASRAAAGRARAGPGARSTSPGARRTRGLVRTRPRGSLLGAPAYDAPATSSRSAAGPRVVSVWHHHHDYPAADIAAPEGSPVYALADAIVVARLGARRALRHRLHDRHAPTASEWTYCHLSYLDPAVTAGAPARRGRGRSASSARPATRPARTCTSSSTRRPRIRRRALVPELRRHRLQLAGRRPDRLDRPRRARAGLRRRPHRKRRNRGTGRPVHPVGG